MVQYTSAWAVGKALVQQGPGRPGSRSNGCRQAGRQAGSCTACAGSAETAALARMAAQGTLLLSCVCV